MINENDAFCPLRIAMIFLLKITKFISPSRWLIGKDPDNLGKLFSKLMRKYENRFLNYHTFFDFYIIICFLSEITIIILNRSGKLSSYYVANLVLLFATIRLIELLGAQLHIIAFRRQKDVILNERKILIPLMCYLEGVLLFTLIYMAKFTILNTFLHIDHKNIFSLSNGLSISSLTILYFSIINYTTTGFGDITALHPTLIKISGLESIFGLIFLAFFISGLVSKASPSQMQTA